MRPSIKLNPKCRNQVRTENGSVSCGIFQVLNGIKHVWLCDECLNSPMEEAEE